MQPIPTTRHRCFLWPFAERMGLNCKEQVFYRKRMGLNYLSDAKLPLNCMSLRVGVEPPKGRKDISSPATMRAAASSITPVTVNPITRTSNEVWNVMCGDSRFSGVVIPFQFFLCLLWALSRVLNGVPSRRFHILDNYCSQSRVDPQLYTTPALGHQRVTFGPRAAIR